MSVVEMNQTSLEDALKTDRPIVLDFWASWCGPCHHFSPTYAQSAQSYPQAIFGKINVEENQDLALKFKVRSIPKVCIIKNGDIVAEHHGSTDLASFKQFLDQHLS